MPKTMNFSLHVGAHKTGTTHFQTSMHNNRDRLKENGVVFYGPERLRPENNPENVNIDKLFKLEYHWLQKDGVHDFNCAERLEGLAEGCENIIFSEENFSGDILNFRTGGSFYLPLYEHLVGRVNEVANVLPDNVRLTVYLATRRADTFLESAFSQSLFQNWRLSHQEFINAVELSDIKWAELSHNLAKIKRVEKVVVWRYEEYPALFYDIVRRMTNWSASKAVEPLGQRAHYGLSTKAVQQAYEYFKKGEACNMIEVRDRFKESPDNPRFGFFTLEQRRQAQELYENQYNSMRSDSKIEILSL